MVASSCAVRSRLAFWTSSRKRRWRAVFTFIHLNSVESPMPAPSAAMRSEMPRRMSSQMRCWTSGVSFDLRPAFTA